jgi:RNA polymerase sigma factor (TIGR02999 family)
MTHIPETIEPGDPKAADQLLPLVYEELRKLAACKLAQEAPGQTLQPTALVHEAWLRVSGLHPQQFQNRAHFFAAAAEAMRRILVDNARRKRAARHGGGQQRVDLPELASAVAEDDDKVLAVNEALDRFAVLDPQKAELVKLRYFVGMTLEEAAKALGLSERTAKRHWAFARAWLHEEIKAQRG